MDSSVPSYLKEPIPQGTVPASFLSSIYPIPLILPRKNPLPNQVLFPAHPRISSHQHSSSQQIKIIQFIPILEYIPLNLTRIHPRHKILHVSRDQKRRIGNNLRPDTDMALFNEFIRL